MNEEQELIRVFYTCLNKLDWRGMIACYTEDIFFYDPVFGNLQGAEVRGMWEMLLSNAKDLRLDYSNIVFDDGYGSCEWVATYTFSRTGRRVVNRAKALFKFTGGRIAEHQDVFNFWNWSRQALGIPGLLFGWSSTMQRQIRKGAKSNLSKFLLSHKP